MSNEQKGEVSIEAGGVTYTLCFSTDAMCATEGKVGKGFPKILMEFGADPSFTLLRALIWGGLREKHPDVTLKQAGDLIIPAGGMEFMMEKVFHAVKLARPQTESADDNPPTPGQTK